MTAPPSPSIVWFRQDLRLADNPALCAAGARGAPVVALYVLDDDAAGASAMGGAARWWLHHSLMALAAGLAQLGTTLTLRRGSARTIVPQLASEIGAGAVFWNRCYEPFAVARDTAIKSALSRAGVAVESFGAALIAEPWTIKSKSGGAFSVFTPFWRTLRAETAPAQPLAAPHHLPGSDKPPQGDALEDWRLTPTRPDWAGGLRDAWRPGEAGGQERLAGFLAGDIESYGATRNLPAVDGVSRLSPYLHWGEVSVRQVWRACEAKAGPAAEPYLRELAWREFAHHLLWQFPELPEKPFNPRFAAFPWRDDAAALAAWRRGRTGYPLVDAGMRELWATGWMHNRVRMTVGSFLVKHLLLPWRAGEDWFWDTLVDADLANNAMNWQWIAGSGADAAPYFRIFNPVLQGEKFDPHGAYVRRWVPELARMPDAYLNKPWTAPAEILRAAGVSLGANYPGPIVDHQAARTRALAALDAMRAETADALESGGEER
jgi:deoxyribodipyrimidine photo-lyase